MGKLFLAIYEKTIIFAPSSTKIFQYYGKIPEPKG